MGSVEIQWRRFRYSTKLRVPTDRSRHRPVGWTLEEEGGGGGVNGDIRGVIITHTDSGDVPSGWVTGKGHSPGWIR